MTKLKNFDIYFRYLSQKGIFFNALIILIFLIFTPAVYAQNLVPNGGFEEFYRCPGTWNYKAGGNKIAPGWTTPTPGTPDLFNKCGSKDAGVPYNFAGVAEAHSGNGYAGIYVWNKQRNYREFLQSKFVSPLEYGKTYTVEFYFRLAPYSRYSIDRIGVLISDSTGSFSDDGLLPLTPVITEIHDSAFHRKSGTWEKLSGEYVARGGEQFITIGNFSSNQETRNFHIRFEPPQEAMLISSAYFYIDDVSVSLPSSPISVPPPDDFIPGEIYVLKNINFEFARYALLPSSFPELNRVAKILLDHPDWKIVLTGHTDDVGTDAYNMTLSVNRTASCKRYLTERGISPERISFFGKGKSSPLINATDSAARATNRRVEARFISD